MATISTSAGLTMTKINYKNYSQQQKILTLMCRFKEKEWWFPYDFMLPEQGDLFVGYEASARLSELRKDYPDMIEGEYAGKYIRSRLCFETITEWLPLLPKDLRYVFHRTGLTEGLPKTAELAAAVLPEPKPTMTVSAVYIGRVDKFRGRVEPHVAYKLKIERLELGAPVRVVEPVEAEYASISAWQLDWRVAK